MGKFAKPAMSAAPPPRDQDAEVRRHLARFLEIFMETNGGEMSPDCAGIETWWPQWQEPYSPRSEMARAAPVIGGDTGTRMVYPYAERLGFTMVAFLRGSDQLRSLVKAGVEDGIWWRGERLEDYARVIAETDEYRRDRGGYVARSKERCRAVIRAAVQPEAKRRGNAGGGLGVGAEARPVAGEPAAGDEGDLRTGGGQGNVSVELESER
jgi:hypothetical protein